MTRNSNDPSTKEYYKNYCKILSEVIITAKNQYHNNLLLHSQNKQKSIWNIIKNLTNNSNKSKTNNIALIKIKDNISDNDLTIANNFNNYFLSFVDNIIDENIMNNENLTSESINPLEYLHNAFTRPRMNIKGRKQRKLLNS